MSVARKAGACIDNSVVRRSNQQQGGSSDMAMSSANDDYPFAAEVLDRRVELVHDGRLFCALERTAADAEHDDTQRLKQTARWEREEGVDTSSKCACRLAVMRTT